MPKLGAWVWINLRIGALSFGGAGRMILFQDAVVKQRRWLSEEEFLECLTVAQLLPGPNLVNLAAYLSQRLFGGLGATVLAVLALVIPGALLSVGAAALLLSLSLERFLQGISLGSIALFVVFLVRMAPRSLVGAGIPAYRLPLALAVAAASLAGLPLFYTLAAGIAAALALEFAWKH